MKKISRTWSRICILCVAAYIIAIFIVPLIYSPIPFYIGAPLMLVALIIKLFILKCPYCGKGLAISQWSKSGNMHCSKCGKPLEYDK